MTSTKKSLFVLCFLAGFTAPLFAQDTESWDKNVSGKEHANIQWFKDAKFGMFIHWGLFSQTGGSWNGKNYYGISEWMMNRGKIPAADYATIAKRFNPTRFNAQQWAQIAKDAGMKYMVVTAKHHEGFAMFDSKVSDFNIVKATPYGKDPMKDLSQAVRNAGLQFGFYYSQYLDWHEPNGGGNRWDFDDKKKDYALYYKTKSIPQIKELVSNYGQLGLLWFDQSGGLDKAGTQNLINEVRAIQPGCLISSRVGNGLGDFKDYGDGEVPAVVTTPGAWEALFTHNDSWGYSKFDYNFKTPKEIIRLLATVSSKGGNLILNVGPDSTGQIPPYSVKYLHQVGQWLKVNGEAIYGTTQGFIGPQPWGVTTSKPGRLFLHVFERPRNGFIVIPGFTQAVTGVHLLAGKRPLTFTKKGNDILVKLPPLSDDQNTVLVINYAGKANRPDINAPLMVSSQYANNPLDAVYAHVSGNSQVKSITSSHYFGDWKHSTCITNMTAPGDIATFKTRVMEPGDYKITLEYACSPAQAGQEGAVTINDKTYQFQTLAVNDYDSHKPLLFIHQTVAITSITKAGLYELAIHPLQQGNELFKLKTIWLEPVN
ncbi:alpha-L-fucosidase [Mucilaginibacter sp. AW1-3]